MVCDAVSCGRDCSGKPTGRKACQKPVGKSDQRKLLCRRAFAALRTRTWNGKPVAALMIKLCIFENVYQEAILPD